ncbi:MAG: cysteine desulfurase [Verrucomicrobia bacterium]|nr:cysteine desulfurase [Verrucomicrobiota bacterium]
MQKIFLDNNGTTQVDPRVAAAILAELEAGPSNPSSIHSFGRAAHQRLARAREQIAAYLGVRPNELVFTSSGTEALNLAILGMKLRSNVITSQIEHAAVYETVKRLGNPVVYLPVGPEGHVQVADIEEIATPDSVIILSAVNSETGVKNPIEEIAQIAERLQIPFIVDGVAWLGKELFQIPRGVSAMAFSGHKIHGPKGIGLLFIRKGCKLEPLLTGGGQEGLRRAGTENLPGIIGLAKAIELLELELPEAILRMERLRNQLEAGHRVNGTGPRVCNTSSITFPGVDGEALLIQLDLQGVAASMGSACASGSLEPSRVLLSMGLSRSEALSTLRFSLSRLTTEAEISLASSLLNTYKLI